MTDRHTLIVEIDSYGGQLRVRCPYDMSDETRPCWPYDLAGERPEPAPQPFCNYEEWAGEHSFDLLDQGARRSIEFALHHVEWQGENGPIFTLGSLISDEI